MFEFTFVYTDGTMRSVPNVERVVYSTTQHRIEVTSQQIATHEFPIGRTLHLFSSTENTTVSHNELRLIKISKI